MLGEPLLSTAVRSIIGSAYGRPPVCIFLTGSKLLRELEVAAPVHLNDVDDNQSSSREGVLDPPLFIELLQQVPCVAD